MDTDQIILRNNSVILSGSIYYYYDHNYNYHNLKCTNQTDTVAAGHFTVYLFSFDALLLIPSSTFPNVINSLTVA